MKVFVAFVVLAILATLGFFFWQPNAIPQTSEQHSEVAVQNDSHAITTGSYTVIPAKSTINWSAKKPLIEGYVNSGTLGVKEGSVTVTDTEATGLLVIDMEMLDVGLTAKKPGREGALEEHLKGERWFAVSEYPTATFSITSAVPRADSDTTFIYEVTGDLTLKGQTHALTFPATIYLGAEDVLHAKASFEFDRTQWGVTSSSANFFENLAENAVSDMVAMSFDITAQAQ